MPEFRLQLRIAEGHTLHNCDPQIRACLVQLMKLNCIALFETNGKEISNTLFKTTAPQKQPDAKKPLKKKSLVRRRQEELNQHVNRCIEMRANDPVISAIIDRYSVGISATFAIDPHMSLKLWRLLYCILHQHSMTQDVSTALDKLHDKFFNERTSKFIMGCVIAVQEDANFLETLAAGNLLLTMHQDFFSILEEIETNFVSNLHGMPFSQLKHNIESTALKV